MNQNNSNEGVYFTLLYFHSTVFFFGHLELRLPLKWSASLSDDVLSERSGEQAVHRD